MIKGNGFKIVYLGGMFQAEYSMATDIRANGGWISFPVNELKFGMRFIQDSYYNNHDQHRHMPVIPDEMLRTYLEDTAPDVVIHRYYLNDPCMHPGSSAVCRDLGIPLLRLAMETDTGENQATFSGDYDALIYAHDTPPARMAALACGKPSFFMPYGVGSAERMAVAKPVREIGMLGYFRGFPSRQHSFQTFISAAGDHRIHVYGDRAHWEKFSDQVEVHRQFNLEDTAEVIGLHKITINAETRPEVQNHYTHKMWQSLGCGVPVVTWHKQGLADIFGDDNTNLVMVHSLKEAAEWIDRLLTDELLREKMARQVYRYVHENFNWTNRLIKILKQI